MRFWGWDKSFLVPAIEGFATMRTRDIIERLLGAAVRGLRAGKVIGGLRYFFRVVRSVALLYRISG